jgi:hypothetical protein
MVFVHSSFLNNHMLKKSPFLIVRTTIRASVCKHIRKIITKYDTASLTMTETNPQDDAKTSSGKDKEEVKEETNEDEEEESKIQAPEPPGTKEEETKSSRDFPNVFYCPITKKVMADPVVLPDGDSYEKSAMVARGDVPSHKLYPNRALQAIIEETVGLSGRSTRAGLKRIQYSMWQQFSQLLDKSAIPSRVHRDLPDSYYGPITFSLMHNPVIDPEGNTYERAAIENWIEVNHTSPITRTTVSVNDLYPNNAIVALLEEEKGKSEGSIHPSIRKWKEEKPPAVLSDPEVGGSASPPAYPTTQAGLEEVRTQRRRAACTFVGLALGLALFIVCVLLAGFSVGTFLLVFTIMGSLCALGCIYDYARASGAGEIDV